MIQGTRGKGNTNIPECAKYTVGGAPNVCVEGRSQHECTHKEIHDTTADFVKKSFMQGNNDIDTSIDKVVEAHEKTFKASGCSKGKGSKLGCIESQLRNYFEDKCGKGNFKVRSVDGKGGVFGK